MGMRICLSTTMKSNIWLWLFEARRTDTPIGLKMPLSKALPYDLPHAEIRASVLYLIQSVIGPLRLNHHELSWRLLTVILTMRDATHQWTAVINVS